MFPQAQVQLCIVHLVQSSFNYVNWKARKLVAADLQAIYRAATGQQAEQELKEFTAKWGHKYPGIGKLWKDSWENIATPEQKAQVLALAKDLPRLRQAATTQSQDRKRMLRLLIQDIAVEKPANRKQLLVHIRWQGGASSDVSVQLPPNMADRVRYPCAVVDRIRELAPHLPEGDIADQLNYEGQVSAKGRPYTAKIIQWVRCRYRIPPAGLKKPEKWPVRQVANRFGTSDPLVYYWIEHKVIRSRRIGLGMPHWITLSAADEEKLREWVRQSRKIQPVS